MISQPSIIEVQRNTRYDFYFFSQWNHACWKMSNLEKNALQLTLHNIFFIKNYNVIYTIVINKSKTFKISY